MARSTRPVHASVILAEHPVMLGLKDRWRRPTPIPAELPSPGVAPTRLEKAWHELVRPYSKSEMGGLMRRYTRKGRGR